VLLLTSSMLVALLRGRRVRLSASDLLDPDRLPGTLDNFSLRFQLAA
jgi:hypothetical protein